MLKELMHHQDMTNVRLKTLRQLLKGCSEWSSHNKAPHKVSDQREQRIPFTPP